MNTKTCYIYDAITGELKAVYQAQQSPLEPGVFIEPTQSTETPPPALGANQAAVFSAGAWSIVPDFRGQLAYQIANAAALAQQITALGALAAGLTVLVPSTPFDTWDAVNLKWIAGIIPDVQGFILALKTAIGGSGPWNTLMTKYPAVYIALQTSDWQTVHDLIVGANAAVVFTPAQYGQIKALITAHGLPVPALP